MRGLAFPLTPQVPEAILSPATTNDDIPIDPVLHSPIVQVRFDYDLALVCADRLGPRFHTHSPIWSTHFSSNPLQVNGFTTDSHKEILLRPRTPFHCCRPSWPSNLHLHLHPRDQERNGADAAIVKAPMPRTNWVNQSLWRLVTSVDEAVHMSLFNWRVCRNQSSSLGHPSCMQLSKIGDMILSYQWKCLECKNCELCGEKGDDVSGFAFDLTKDLM